MLKLIKSLVIFFIILVILISTNYAYAKRLQVPYKRQGPYECGPASLYMVLKYWGVNVDYRDIVDSILEGKSTPLSNMVEYAGKLGFYATTAHVTVDDLKYYIDEGWPVIVLQWASLSYKNGHYRVVIGYNNNGFIVHDPSDGPSITLSYDYFIKLWKKCGNAAVIIIPMSIWEENKGESLVGTSRKLEDLLFQLEHLGMLNRESFYELLDLTGTAGYYASVCLFEKARSRLEEFKPRFIEHLDKNVAVKVETDEIAVYTNLKEAKLYVNESFYFLVVDRKSKRVVPLKNVKTYANGVKVSFDKTSTYIGRMKIEEIYEKTGSKNVEITFKVSDNSANLTISILEYFRLNVLDKLRNLHIDKIVGEGFVYKIESVNQTEYDLGNKTKYVFKGVLVNGVEYNQDEVVVKSNTTIIYEWDRFYLVTVRENPFTESFSKWVKEGDLLNITPIDTSVLVESGVKLVLDEWIINDDKITSYNGSVLVDEPLDIEPIYHTEYYVEIVSESDIIKSGWYREGETVSVDIPKKISFLLYDKIFKGWYFENGTLLSENPRIELIIKEPLKITAYWEEDFTKIMLFAVLIVAVAISITLLYWHRGGKNI